MITNETFAKPEKVLDYYNNNLVIIQARENINSIEQIEESNYYLFEEDGEQNIMLVSSKTGFYITLIQILTKKPGNAVFSKNVSPGKNNYSLRLVQNKISSRSLQIKHIESDSRIKSITQAITPTQPLIQQRPALPLTQQRPAPQVQVGLTEYEGGPQEMRPTFEGGHMLDYIRYQEAQREIGPRPSNSSRQIPNNSSSSVQPSVPEEIVDNVDYKDNVTCKICLNNKINIVCIPCGHCFCSACNTQSRNNLCALCRKPITKAQAIFI